MENFAFKEMHLGEMLIRRSLRFFLLLFITLEIAKINKYGFYMAQDIH